MSFDGNPFAVPEVQRRGENTYVVSHGSDKNLIVEFFRKPLYMEFKSTQEGRQVWEERDYVRVTTPGMHGNTFEEEVGREVERGEPSYKERFQRQWIAYERQQEQIPDGQPLGEWPPITKAEVLMARANNVHTVEQLGGLTDNQMGLLGLNTRKLRDLAKNYLAKAKDGAIVTQLTAENQKLATDLDMLKKAVAELKGEDTSKLAQELAAARAELEQMKAAQSARKKPGPKPKSKEVQ